MTHDRVGLDAASLEQLYVRLEKPLYNVVYRWLWDPEESQDVVQEAFVRLWKMRTRVRLESVEPLVYKIALNLAAKRRRSRKVWRWLGLESAPEPLDTRPDSEMALDAAQREHALRQAIEDLPEKLRRVVTLSAFSELSYPQVGELLGIPPGTVGSRRNKALALLKDALESGELP